MTTWVKFQDFQHQKLKKEILHIRPSGAKYSLNFRYSTDKLSLKVQANPFKKQNLQNVCMNFPEIHITNALYISCNYCTITKKQYDFLVAFRNN